ncbi:MAG: hypothetical protein JKY46_00010 [Robiginitomaculum sp.]|nr:hypothetical protein [Robiginitomaculum sp.]
MAKALKKANKADSKTKAKATAKKTKPVDDGIHPAARPFLWLGSHWFQRSFMWGIGFLVLIFVGLDLFRDLYGHFAWQKVIGAKAIFGFVAFTFAVLMGWPLRKLTGRKDDYYEDGEPDD